ncbi:MAG: hypothetical protein G01um101433_234 [Parcubacteria group bacterium Gr01-1014_33]|nr:MAG: hypothetical protein G01um101433_234 [Parcubacteria group bacterium Gr01-1014_33]
MVSKIVIIIIVVFLVLAVLIPFGLTIAGIHIIDLGRVKNGAQEGNVLLRTEIGGKEWKNVALSDDPRVSFPREIFTVAFHPTQPDVMYSGGKASGLLRSTTQGTSWKKADINGKILASDADIYAIRISPRDPRVIYAAVFQQKRGRVMKSMDGGSSFQEIYSVSRDRAGVFDIFLNPYDENFILVGTGEGGVLESRDGGTRWRTVHWFGESVTQIAANPVLLNQMYAALGNGTLWKTSDGGLTWTEITPSRSPGNGKFIPYTPPLSPFSFIGGGSSDSGLGKFAQDPRRFNQIFVATKEGIFRSSDSGATWRPLGIVVPREILPAGAIAQGAQAEEIFVGIASRLYKTENGGVDWSFNALPSAARITGIFIHPQKPNVIFVTLKK